MPKIECFRVRSWVGVRITCSNYERGYDTGAAISVRIGIGLFAPELRIEWGAYTRETWTDRRTGKRRDFGYGFERGEWVNPYGVSGIRWDRAIRFALARRRNAAARRRADRLAKAIDDAEVEHIPF